MWWQILPSWFIVGGLVTLPVALLPMTQYIFTGRPTMRCINEGQFNEIYIRDGYRRDWSMCGNEYESRGLDQINDEDD